jgi:hypothetical protein
MSKNKGAPSPSLVTSTGTLHDLKSLCDLCGEEADSEVAEVVALDCSYAQCPPEAELYHQACLEKYLKSIRCERCARAALPRRRRACVACCRRRRSPPCPSAAVQKSKDRVPLSPGMRQSHQVPRGVQGQGAPTRQQRSCGAA